MRKKKLFTLFLTILTVIALVLTFSGCSTTKVENGEVYSLYCEVLSKIASNYELNSKKAFNGDISIDIDLKNNERNKDINLNLAVLANVDLSDDSTNANNNFVIELKDKTSGNKLLALYADGESLYIDLPQKHYKVKSFKLYDMITNADKTDMSNLISILAYGAGLLFDNAEYAANKYIFYYDMTKFLSKIEEVLTDENILNDIAKVFSCESWSELKEEVSDIKGSVKYVFSGDKLENVQWMNNGDDKTLNIKCTKMMFGAGKKELNIIDRLDKNADYISTKLMNFTLRGDLKLESQGKQLAKYTYELRTNLDPLELIANKGDFKLDEDDMAHFVLKNRLIDNTQEYNSSKIAAKDGIQLEIAYSPKEFKTNNVLVAINLKSLLPKSMFEELGLPAMASNILPEFYGMHFDPSVLNELFNSDSNQSLKTGNIFGMLKSILGDGISVNAKDNNLLTSISKVGNRQITDIDLDIDEFIFADRTNEEYKIGANFLQSTGSENVESKDFGKALGYHPAKESIAVEDNGRIELRTAKGILVNANNPLKVSDIESVIGGTIKYNYIDFYDVERTPTSSVKIIKIIGLDKNKFEQPQKVKFITTPADGKNLLGIVTALGVMPNIPCNVFEGEIVLINQ